VNEEALAQWEGGVLLRQKKEKNIQKSSRVNRRFEDVVTSHKNEGSLI
jgi:hypothetical protein